MMTKNSLYLLNACILFALGIIQAAQASSIMLPRNLSVQSKDKKAELRLYIDWPEPKLMTENKTFPVMIVVPGTGGTSDLYLNSREPDFSQDDDGLSGLGRKLNQRGIIVVRFDNRGIVNPRVCMPDHMFLDDQAYLHRCWNNAERATIDFQSWREDISSVYQRVIQLPYVDKKRLGILGFSEGMVHSAHLLAEASLSAKLFVGIGGPAESMREVALYQKMIPQLISLTQYFKDTSQVISLNELKGVLFDRYRTKPNVLEALFSPKTELTLLDVQEQLQRKKSRMNKYLDAIKPFPRSGKMAFKSENYSVVQHSIGYDKDVYFEDIGLERPIDALLRFPGSVLLYYGENDQKVLAPVNVILIKAAQKTHSNIRYEVFPGLEHSLEDKKNDRVPDTVSTKIANDIADAL